ncbi:MAG: NAD(P)H-hydrate dehydratase [Dehalococcoidales bacterium]|nr:NAD(P)H-hydrate dehydratase [Dehalococcoidales bacterium]
MKIVTSEQMRRIEQDCAAAGLPTNVLMENAGKAVAAETRRILGSLDKQHIVCLIGPGNNGGDGLVAARYLHDWGARVSVYLCAGRPSDDTNLDLVKQRSLTLVEAAENNNLVRLDELLSSATAVLDAIFGTGKVRPFSNTLTQVLNSATRARKKNNALRIITVDLPSGLNADTGEVDPACLYADNTLTLAFPKPGLFAFPGAERVGKLAIADIGIPPHLSDSITRELMTADWASAILPSRPLDANKGSFGKVLVVGGSINYIGAVYLACSGALRVGAGLVTLSTPCSLQPILAGKLTEVTYLPLPESSPGIISAQAIETVRPEFERYNTLVAGSGLGQSQAATEFINTLLGEKDLPALVLDADALNALAKIPGWWQQLSKDAILTPHPGEMSRLSGASVEDVQKDRFAMAESLARKWHKTVVLKGAYTVIAAPDGRSRLCPFANPGLASAGTGDVLTGVIGGLLAQGLAYFDAASLGVYLHGHAGERIREQLGDTGMVASDLLPALPRAIRDLKRGVKICF